MSFLKKLLSIVITIVGIIFTLIYFLSISNSNVDNSGSSLLWMLIAGIALSIIGVIFIILAFKNKPQKKKAEKDPYTKEIEELKEKAMKGDIASNIELAKRCEDKGRYDIAFKWYKRAADLGSMDACYILGLYYKNGKGITNDDALAKQYFKKAADMGHIDASYELGCCYLNGIGVAKNIETALKYFELAGNNDHVQAMVEAGKICFAKGQENGRLKNNWYKRAVAWFEKAHEKGSGEASHLLATCWLNGYGVSHKSETQWYDLNTKASSRGNAEASRTLGSYWYNSYKEIGKVSYLRNAYEYYDLAVKQGDKGSISMRDVCKSELERVTPKPRPENNSTPKKHSSSSSSSKKSSNHSSSSSSSASTSSGPSEDRYFYFEKVKITNTPEFLRTEYVGDTPMYKHVDIHVKIVFTYRNCNGRVCEIVKTKTLSDRFDTEKYSEYDCQNEYGRYYNDFLAVKDYTYYSGESMVKEWL